MTEPISDDVLQGLRPPTLEEIPMLPVSTTVPVFGAWIGISRGSAYTAAKNGLIPTEEIGGRMVVIVPKALAHFGISVPNDSAAASGEEATATNLPLQEGIQDDCDPTKPQTSTVAQLRLRDRVRPPGPGPGRPAA